MVSSYGLGPGPGVGLGWRRELAAPLLAAPSVVDFIEVIAEACFPGAPLCREVPALAEIFPGRILPHGLKLSLGSAGGIDPERARRLGALVRTLRAPVVTEHVAFTSCRSRGALSGRREIGHLIQLPLTRTAISVLARNLESARRHLPDVPFLLETPAWTLRWPDDEMDEGTFFHELVRATSCDLLLDLANVYANARNSGADPLALLRSYPLDRVAMVHLAGGAVRDGFYVDTHAHPIPAEVFSLLAELLRTTGPLPIIIERDGNFPPFRELAAELDEARALLARCAPRTRAPAHTETAPPPRESDLSIRAMADRQWRLTELLTAAEPPEATSPFDAAAVARSRSILSHKRADESRHRARFAGPPPSRGGEAPRLGWARRILFARKTP